MEDSQLNKFLVYKPQFNGDTFKVGNAYRMHTKGYDDSHGTETDIIITNVEPLRVEVTYLASPSHRSDNERQMRTKWIPVEKVFTEEVTFDSLVILK